MDLESTGQDAACDLEIHLKSGHAPQAALVVAAGIGSLVGSLSVKRTCLAFSEPVWFNPAKAALNDLSRKSCSTSAPSARSTRSRNAAKSISLLRASIK